MDGSTHLADYSYLGLGGRDRGEPARARPWKYTLAGNRPEEMTPTTGDNLIVASRSVWPGEGSALVQHLEPWHY